MELPNTKKGGVSLHRNTGGSLLRNRGGSLHRNRGVSLLRKNGVYFTEISTIPTNGQIKIRYSEIKDTKLHIVNMLGVIVKEIMLSKNVQGVTTNISDLASGIYLYRHVCRNETLHIGKLIIEN